MQLDNDSPKHLVIGVEGDDTLQEIMNEAKEFWDKDPEHEVTLILQGSRTKIRRNMTAQDLGMYIQLCNISDDF